MFQNFFAKYSEYEIVEKPSLEVIRMYSPKLPNDILQLWQNYGWGTYMNGYLRLINPSDFAEFTNEYVENIGFECVPFAVSAFGDLFVWVWDEFGYVDFYDFRHAKSILLAKAANLDLLFDKRFIEDDYIWDKLNCSNYSEVTAKLGVPTYSQCYGYFPLLSLGGPERIENLRIVDLQTHIELMAQAVGAL